LPCVDYTLCIYFASVCTFLTPDLVDGEWLDGCRLFLYDRRLRLNFRRIRDDYVTSRVWVVKNQDFSPTFYF